MKFNVLIKYIYVLYTTGPFMKEFLMCGWKIAGSHIHSKITFAPFLSKTKYEVNSKHTLRSNINYESQYQQVDCINGLIEAKVANALAKGPPVNFDEYILRTMGEGIANIFMRPYNFKVWAVPTTEMQCSWLGERVATANVAKVFIFIFLVSAKSILVYIHTWMHILLCRVLNVYNSASSFLHTNCNE